MGFLYRDTVFPRINAAAFIYFVGQFGAATIRGRRLLEGGVYSFRQYDPRRVPRLRPQHPAEVLSTSRENLLKRYGSYKSHSRNKQKYPQNGQDWASDVFGGSKASSFSISFRFLTKRYTHGTSNLLAGVSEDDDEDPFAGLEEDEDEVEENETVLDDC